MNSEKCKQNRCKHEEFKSNVNKRQVLINNLASLAKYNPALDGIAAEKRKEKEWNFNNIKIAYSAVLSTGIILGKGNITKAEFFLQSAK